MCRCGERESASEESGCARTCCHLPIAGCMRAMREKFGSERAGLLYIGEKAARV